MKIVISSSIREAMNQPGIAMVRKNNRFIRREQRVEVMVRETMTAREQITLHPTER